jgi:hypothetical protein
MADVERIAPPVPTLPPPVGRNIGSGRRQRPPHEPPPRRDPAPGDEHPERDRPTEHIDEYV